MGITYMTLEGYKKLEAELNHLIKVRRREIAEQLAHARSMGDLRENSEYDAAKEEQAMNESKIGELSARLASAQIIDNMEISADKAYIGALVKLLDMDSKEEFEYKLVSDAEADFLHNKISISSPIGKGLLGHRVNDIVKIKVPVGILELKILEISR
jgi:transcription elongation factor GreA